MKTAREVAAEKLQSGRKPREEKQTGKGDAELGYKLRELRTAAGLSMTDVQEAMDLSGSSMLQAYETGNTMPGIRNLALLAAFYEVSLDDLAGHLVEQARNGTNGQG